MRAAGSGSNHAVLPAYTGAGIDATDHGQNRCSLGVGPVVYKGLCKSLRIAVVLAA